MVFRVLAFAFEVAGAAAGGCFVTGFNCALARFFLILAGIFFVRVSTRCEGGGSGEYTFIRTGPYFSSSHPPISKKGAARRR